MSSFGWFLRSLTIYSIISLISTNEYHPLAFNPHTLEIYNLKETPSNESDSRPCAVACPAEYNNETDFIKNFSDRHSFLFMERVDTVFQQQSSIKTKCQERFVMSVLLHSTKIGELVEFGFEVYFEKSKFQNEQIDSANFNEFREIPDDDSILEHLGIQLRNHLTFPWSQREIAKKKWGFLWLPKISLRYDLSQRILQSLKYKIHPIKQSQLKVNCSDYLLYGNWYNTNTHLEWLYTYNNQAAIFHMTKLPEGRCWQNGKTIGCVKRHNLVLPYHFQAASPGTVSCSNLTTIPLWHEIPDELMDRMEKFIIAIAQVMGENHELIVIHGVLGQLVLPSLIDDKPIKIYLNHREGKVPVPKITYKMIRHRTNKCDEKTGELCWFDVVIVIHNYATYTTDERLCAADECERLGWDSIQYLESNKKEENKWSFVYCCELDDIVAKSIAFPLGGTQNSPLNLRSFPVYDETNERHDRRDILNSVEIEFQKLVGTNNEGSQ